MIDKKLLAILACPVCKKGLKDSGKWLICDHCGLKYPVDNNIPTLLFEKAQKLKK